MTTDAWITVAVVVVMLGALARDVASPAATVLAATLVLLVLDVIDEGEAFSGFSNPAPLTVAALYVLARAVEKSGLLTPAVTGVLRGKREVDRATVARVALPTAGASAFINNTPLVGMLIPEITAWAGRRNLSASRLLLPLSYAAILGGTVTAIGTSTNLLVSGLLVQRGEDPFSLFELAPIGGLSALAGLVLLITLVPVLLPQRRAIGEDLGETSREFAVQMEVEEGGRLDGATVEEAGLRHLAGVYLVQVEQGGRVVTPVRPDERLRGGDRLTFVGLVDLIVDLQRTRGLRSTEDEHLLAVESPQHTFFEAVLGPESPLVGRTLKEADFRAHYQAAVVAIHRAGEQIRAKLGDVTLRPGDTLVVLADSDFRSRWRDGSDFLLVAALGGAPPSATRRAPLVGLVALAVIGLATFEVFTILEAAMLGAGVLLISRVLTVGEAFDAINLEVVVLIAAAFGVGAAVEGSGLAQIVADGLVGTLDPLGTVGIVLGVVLATTFLTEVITNNAAAVVIFPIALSIAISAGIDPRTMAVAVAVTASSSFLTPLGYQTNAMVYGPGGYRFGDYLRAGLPVNITVVAVITAMTVTLA
jgi:di/tricarboxylate transporter